MSKKAVQQGGRFESGATPYNSSYVLLWPLTHQCQGPRLYAWTQGLTILDPLQLTLQHLDPLFLAVDQGLQPPEYCVKVWVWHLTDIQLRTEDLHLGKRRSVARSPKEEDNSPSPQGSWHFPKLASSKPQTTSWLEPWQCGCDLALVNQTAPLPSNVPGLCPDLGNGQHAETSNKQSGCMPGKGGWPDGGHDQHGYVRKISSSNVLQITFIQVWLYHLNFSFIKSQHTLISLPFPSLHDLMNHSRQDKQDDIGITSLLEHEYRLYSLPKVLGVYVLEPLPTNGF